MSAQLMAIVTEGKGGRNYYSPDPAHTDTAKSAEPEWMPHGEISHWPGRTNVVEYGMTTFESLFTPRQLTALTTFSDLVAEAREQVYADAVDANLPDDDVPLREGRVGARAYAEAVSVYLAFGSSRLADRLSSIASWMVHVIASGIHSADRPYLWYGIMPRVIPSAESKRELATEHRLDCGSLWTHQQVPMAMLGKSTQPS